MPAPTRRLPRLVLLLALLFTLVRAASLEASAESDKGGGGGNVHSPGGWTVLTRTDSPSIPFASQQDCTKFLTQGGVAVALQAVPPTAIPPTATATATATPSPTFVPRPGRQRRFRPRTPMGTG